MRSIRKVPLVACFLGMVLPLWFSCGGGGGRSTPPLGTLSVTLVDGPAPDFKEINLNIQKVEIHASANAAESGWITVSEPNKTIDLLKLTDGVVETLAAGRTLDPGRYQQLRLVLGESGNTLKLANGSVVPLEVPSAQKSGIKIPLSFQVAVGTTADIWIDFDGAHSIQVRGTGGPAITYVLRPVVHGYEKVVTGGVSGVLTGPGGALLVGAMVTAQSVDGSGNVTILRSVQTAANGTYSLNLLPLSQPIFVVTQPVIGTVSYPPQASSALTLSASTPTLTVNFTFTNPATSVGGANGAITPIAGSSQSDTVLLLTSVRVGGPEMTLAVASVNGVVDLPSETYAFTAVPARSYQVQALRSTLNQDGTTTTTRSQTSPSFSVDHGTSTVRNIAF